MFFLNFTLVTVIDDNKLVYVTLVFIKFLKMAVVIRQTIRFCIKTKQTFLTHIIVISIVFV